ncbi:MAG: transposase [Planctomycetaceae bacterium]
MRFWLLTSTFYGNWLPGDERGFVGRVWENRPGDCTPGQRKEHDRSGEVFDAEIPGLKRASESRMSQPPIRIGIPHAECLLQQFRETAKYRNWSLLIVALMSNHVHWVVGMDESLHGSTALQSFKGYGSRALNQRFGTQPSGTWWTSKGSARALLTDEAIENAIQYVLQQEFPLLIWKADIH